MLTGCTIIAGNYAAFARTLARSFHRHHPGARFVVLVVDDTPVDTEGDDFILWRLSDLGQSRRELSTMAAIYTVMEFCTAVKPWLVSRLFDDADDDPVVYLDPDIEVTAPLYDVVAPAMEEGMVLTPHVLEPMPRDGRRPSEADILGSGIYNLGFLAVGPRARTSGFVDFWAERLRRDAIIDHDRMLFTDQRWVDFAPLFPHAICRDPGCNVAYWNVWGRPLSRDADGRYLAGGHLLRFFHFSGFDPERPHLLSSHQGADPRMRLPDHPVLAAFCGDYATELLGAGYSKDRRRPYGWARSARGLEITPAMRRAYRSAVIEAERTDGAFPPGPFDDDGGAAFAEWLCTPVEAGSISQLLLGRWETEPGVRVVFPDPVGALAGPYAAWAREHPDDRVAPAELERAASAYPAAEHPAPLVDPAGRAPIEGINLYGYFDAEMSIGQVARTCVDALAAVGVSFDAVPERSSGLVRQGKAGPASWAHDVNLLCVNADRTAEAVAALGSAAFVGRHTAGLWAWETPMLPEQSMRAFDLVDEVWVNSTYVARAVADAGLPVRVLTQPVPVPRWRTVRTRADLGLPDGFVVLCSFDWMSVAERKNPHAVVRAYTQAFGPDEGAALVFKTINGAVCWPDLDALRLAIAERPDVVIIDRAVRSWEMTAYLQLCDCYISLHRSEGFGLSIAEAMACAKPTVATAHSGNLDFMDATVAHLVPADLVPIPAEVRHYGGLGDWAEPDIEYAAACLRQIRDDPHRCAQMGERARMRIAERHNLEVAGKSLVDAAAALRTQGVHDDHK